MEVVVEEAGADDEGVAFVLLDEESCDCDDVG